MIERFVAVAVFALLSRLACAPRLLPVTHQVGAISCDGPQLQVLSDDHGGDGASPRLAYFSRIEVGERRVSTVPIGSGAVMQPAAFLGPTIVAVLYEFTVLGDRPDAHHIVRTRDGGRTWQSLDSTPPEATGVAFVNPQIGWSWSDHALYATSNSGDDWKQISIPEGHISRSGPLPIVASGSLWVPLNHGLGPRDRRNALVRVTGDEVSVLRSNDSISLALLASHRGDLWAVTRPPDREIGSRLYRIEADRRGTLTEVSALPPGSPLYIGVHDDGIVVALARHWTEGGRPFLVRSSDGGRSWSRARKVGLLAEGFCSTSAEKTWFISNVGTVELLD